MKYDLRSLLTLICSAFIIDVVPEDQPGYETAEWRQEAGRPVCFMKSIRCEKAQLTSMD